MKKNQIFNDNHNDNHNDKELITFIKHQTKQQIKDYNMKIDNMQRIFNKNIFKDNFRDNLIYIIVKNGKIYILFEEGDSRKKIIINYVVNILKKWFQTKNKKTVNLFIPFFISDTYFYHENDIPFFVESKPGIRKGILIPDSNSISMKLEDKMINFDNFLRIVDEKKCEDQSKKKPIIFFSGANTGADKHNIRMKLKKLSENNKNYQIYIKESYFPLYYFCQFKYLLNLPGHQPWSYRFMKIIAMNSLVIDVSVLQKFKDKNYFYDKWIQCYLNFFKKDKDFIQIDYHWIEDKTKNDNVYEIYNKINEVFKYYQKNADEYLKIVKSAERKSKMLSMKIIEKTFLYIIFMFNKELLKVNGRNDFEKNIDFFLNHPICKSQSIQVFDL